MKPTNTEELLKLLEQAESKENSSDSVFNFLTFYNFKTGKETIKLNLVYKLYKQFTKEPLSFVLFRARINDYFKVNKGKITINQSALTVHKDILDNLSKTKANKPNKGMAKEFTQYCYTYDIQSGTIYISSKVLYYLYKEWKQVDKPLLSLNTFITLCKLTFKFKITQKYSCCFSLDTSIYSKINKPRLDYLTELLHETKKASKLQNSSKSKENSN